MIGVEEAMIRLFFSLSLAISLEPQVNQDGAKKEYEYWGWHISKAATIGSAKIVEPVQPKGNQT